MKIFLFILLVFSTNETILQKPRKLFDTQLYREDSLRKNFNKDIDDDEYKKEVDEVTSEVDKNIKQLSDQKFAMKKIMDKTLERKTHYVEYAYHKLSYEVDSTLEYLLNNIAEIDGGPDAKSWLKDKENDYHKGYDN
jgi:hypothetical protein